MSDYRNVILQGDVREKLRELPDESVHCVVTSPPYWGLRDYDSEGMIGLEPALGDYVDGMVDVFREVRRVLRKDGTCWLNLGDSYHSGDRGGYRNDAHRWEKSELQKGNRGNAETIRPNPLPQEGLKDKDLAGVPWRVALALQADGWWLRADIIWSKPNPMPSSVTDRPSMTHEYVFLLAKSQRYYYDADAVREPAVSGPADVRKMIEGKDRIGGLTRELTDPLLAGSANTNIGRKRAVGTPGTRNRRTVWEIATAPLREEHFASYPVALVKPCILAGTSERGVCAECGAPWRRIVEIIDSEGRLGKSYHDHTDDLGLGQRGIPEAEGAPERRTIGWEPTCKHEAATLPAIVLDPFMGSGTTGIAALQAARDYVGIELNPEYVKLAERRLAPLKDQHRLL